MEKGKSVNFWSPEEDRQAIELFNHFIINESLTLTEAKKKIASKMQRTYDSLNYRYHKKFRNEISSDARKKIKENSLSNILKQKSENELPEEAETMLDLFRESHTNEEEPKEEKIQFDLPEFQALADRIKEYHDIEVQIQQLQERSKALQEEIKLKPVTGYFMSIVNKN